MEPVRIGIIGCGVIGSHHIDATTDDTNIDLAAIADLKPDLGKEKAAAYNIKKVYVEGLDLLEDETIQGVVLALPACGRGVLAKRAFERGIHVLTEKPVGMNGVEVEELIALRGDLLAGSCCSRYRFTSSAQAVTDFIATGALGDIRVIHCRALRPGGPPPEKAPPIWRLRTDLNGGGIMSNWGCYDLDYLLGITGWSIKPEVVFGQTWTVPPKFHALADPSSDAETHLVATVQCENNVAIHYERGEMVTATPRLSWEIIGTEGSLDLEMVKAEKTITFHKAVSETGVESEVIWEGVDEMTPVHAGPIRDFAMAIREGRQPKTSLEQALVVQRITDGIYASAKSGGSVEVGE